MGHFLLNLQSNFVLLLLRCKDCYKQGYIHASYQVAEMAFLSIMNTHFFYRYFRYFRWFDLSYAWSYRLLEAWL